MLFKVIDYLLVCDSWGLVLLVHNWFDLFLLTTLTANGTTSNVTGKLL